MNITERGRAAVVDPDADPVLDRSRLRFAAMMVAVGVAHFVAPRFFERIVPRWFPWPREAVLWSGVAEVASGALLAVPSTKRIGGFLATATIVAVYPANIQMAIDATQGQDVGVPAWAAWLRLPLQIPMIRRAWSFTR
ncbi:MAG: hypothetical protein ACKO5A_01360 [Actinomycetota bacterium]